VEDLADFRNCIPPLRRTSYSCCSQRQHRADSKLAQILKLNGGGAPGVQRRRLWRARSKDWNGRLKRTTFRECWPSAWRTLAQRRVIGTMFAFLSNDSEGQFPQNSCLTAYRHPAKHSKIQSQVIGTMFGFLPTDLRQRCHERPITSGLRDRGRDRDRFSQADL
jgi:hypothetical protein